MKLVKHICFLVILVVLFIPASISSIWTFNEILGKNTYQNQEYMASTYYKANDEIGYYTNWCENNDFGGRTLGTNEEKLSACVDSELRIADMTPVIGGLMFYVSLISIPLFLICLFFYIKWIRKNK